MLIDQVHVTNLLLFLKSLQQVKVKKAALLPLRSGNYRALCNDRIKKLLTRLQD